MKKILLLLAVVLTFSFVSRAQNTGDFSGLVKTVTMTNAQTDSTLVSIGGSRSAITFKYDITKTSGTIAGTIVLQYKVTNLLGENQWFTYNTYTLTDATANAAVSLPYNPALRWKILTNTTGTSVSVHRQFLVYRK